jgi:hypothetical protein
MICLNLIFQLTAGDDLQNHPIMNVNGYEKTAATSPTIIPFPVLGSLSVPFKSS